MKKFLQIKKIPIKNIKLDGLQPRQVINKTELKILRDSIKNKGMFVPILVEKIGENKYGLQDGERRFRACKSAGKKEIEVIVGEFKDKLEKYEVQFEINMKRSTIKLPEMAKAVERFIKEYKSKNPDKDPLKRMVEISGYSRNYIETCDEIIKSSPQLRKLINSYKISGYTVKEINSATKDKYYQAGISEAIIEATEKKKRPPSALVSRLVKKDLVRIEKEGSKYTNQEKSQIAKGFFNQKIGIIEGKGNFPFIIEMIRGWEAELEKTPINKLENKELNQIASALNNLLILFQAKRENLYGKGIKGKRYRLLPTGNLPAD